MDATSGTILTEENRALKRKIRDYPNKFIGIILNEVSKQGRTDNKQYN